MNIEVKIVGNVSAFTLASCENSIGIIKGVEEMDVSIYKVQLKDESLHIVRVPFINLEIVKPAKGDTAVILSGEHQGKQGPLIMMVSGYGSVKVGSEMLVIKEGFLAKLATSTQFPLLIGTEVVVTSLAMRGVICNERYTKVQKD
jgi:hypothetical protein